MKTTVKLPVLFVVALATVTVNAQDKEVLQQKINKYGNHKDLGIVMMVLSVPVTIFGASVFKDGVDFSYREHPDNQWQGMDLVVGGIAIGVVGIGMFAGGVVMYVNGSRKKKQYQLKLNELKVGTYCNPGQAGITLTCRF